MRQPISRPCGHDTPETNPERHELLTEQRDLSRSRATQVYKRAARSMPSYQSPSCPLPSRPVTTLAYAGAHAHLDAVACLLTLARCALRTSWPAELVRTSHVTFISGMRGYLDAFPNTDTLSMSTEKKKVQSEMWGAIALGSARAFVHPSRATIHPAATVQRDTRP